MTRHQAKRIRKIIEEAVSKEEDVVVAENPNLLPTWRPNMLYPVGKKIAHNDVAYKVLQEHTSQIGWEPDVAVSLFAKILIPDPSVIPVWEQPDSTNPYMTGDKVKYPDENGLVYESLIDNNIWSPEAYPQGWRVVE